MKCERRNINGTAVDSDTQGYETNVVLTGQIF